MPAEHPTRSSLCSNTTQFSGLMDPPRSTPSSAPPSSGSSNSMKTYVFVDEYNRHKRLKVMRACDGCRKRKIRCDGAIQNGPWPCGACVRLKLKCVPPSLDGEDDQFTPDSTSANSGQFVMQTPSPLSAKISGDSPPPLAAPSDWNVGMAPGGMPGPTSAPAFPIAREGAVYSPHMYGQPVSARREPSYSDDEYFPPVTAPVGPSSGHMVMPDLHRTQTDVSNSSGGDPHEVDATIKEVSDQMGDLSIDVTSVPAYVANEKKFLAETPAVEEPDVELPPSFSMDSTLRIPPNMMPVEERALECFGYYFDYIHPYVPVLHQEEFLRQWRTARDTISPLIIEGIFACVAVYLEGPLEVRRWLALASKHEESFKDVPRLSTVQGLMILLKARETVHRRGYYYRSWMELKFIVNMAIDLGLHEHYDRHRDENTCPLNPSQCMIQKRIWQDLLLLEIFIGGVQGRSDFSVPIETVDPTLPTPHPEIEDFEFQTSRRATYFTHVMLYVKRTNNMYQAMRKVRKDWPLDAEFEQHNAMFERWPSSLPPDMQISNNTLDGPILLRGKHYVTYMHLYYHVVVIMHHRPQMNLLLERKDPAFQHHMTVCNESAALICRLQEALYRDFGLHGLQFMQRGLGLTIYAILTCTMLHLATITAPDPATNARARMYFARHMRILEHCIPSARPEVVVQINNLREAFSQDTSQPFELRAGLGQRSPSQESQALPVYPPQDTKSAPPDRSTDPWTNLPDATSSRTLSNASQYSQPFDDIPPAPAAGLPYPPVTSSFNVPTSAYQPINMHQVTSAPQQGYTVDAQPVISPDAAPPAAQIWDPSGIFTQWNAAFGQPQAPPPPTSVSPQDPRMQPSPPAPMMPQGGTPNMHPSVYPGGGSSQPVTPEAAGMPTVTPVMWQDVFTSAYVSGHGRKRNREESVDMGVYNQFRDR